MLYTVQGSSLIHLKKFLNTIYYTWMGGKMQKILIVEDDKKIRKELELFLNKNGFMAVGLEKFDNIIKRRECQSRRN